MKHIYIVLLLGICTYTNAQKVTKKFDTKIQKAEKVNIKEAEGVQINGAGNVNLDVNNNYYSDVTVNPPKPTNGKLYILSVQGFQKYRTDSAKKEVEDTLVTEYIFGNPDNEITRDVRIVMNHSRSIENAFFENPFFIQAKNEFKPNLIRDSYFQISPDKKVITFTAGYIGAGTNVKIKVVTLPTAVGQKVTMEGVGKPF